MPHYRSDLLSLASYMSCSETDLLFLVVFAASSVFFKMLSRDHNDLKQICQLLEDANSNCSDDS